MKYNTKKIEIRYGKSHLEFDEQLVVTLHPYSSNNVSVTIGSIGYPDSNFDMILGESKSIKFDNIYEVRLLEYDTIQSIFMLTELPLNDYNNTIFIGSKLFNSQSEQDPFSEEELSFLKGQLSSLKSKVDDLFKMNAEHAAFVKASFDMLAKKLDEGTKASWRQAAYGVMTSIVCSIPTDLSQAGQFYDLVRNSFTHVSNLLGK